MLRMFGAGRDISPSHNAYTKIYSMNLFAPTPVFAIIALATTLATGFAPPSRILGPALSYVKFGSGAGILPLSSSSVVVEESTTGSGMTAELLRTRMEQVAIKIQEKYPSRGGLFSVQSVQEEDPEILSLLETSANVSFDPPKTMAGLTKVYLTHGSGGFIAMTFLSTCCYRLCLSGSPLGLEDLFAVIVTRILWEAQEWAIHSRWFHGNHDYRAQSLFRSHDWHHDLPYYHVAVEPMRMTVVWFLVVLGISGLSVGLLGAPDTTVATSFATYEACAIIYSFMHCICHSRVPLQGWLKGCKEYHIKHHISPAHHLNMGPNRIDKLMKTDSYDTRLAKARHEIPSSY